MAGHVSLSLQHASEMGGDAGTQFEPHSDDEDTLYNVEKILDEAGRRYLVQWEGRDPATGKKWPPDWVPKTDCTDDLIADWKLEKERRKRGRASSTKSASLTSEDTMARPPPGKTRSTLSKHLKPRVPAPTVRRRSKSRSQSPDPVPVRTKRRSIVYVELPAPRTTKRRRESESEAGHVSPVKRLKLDGPASPLPPSPFDHDDGGIKKKRVGPTTYRKRKPGAAVTTSPLSRKVSGPFTSRTNNGPFASRIPPARTDAGPSRIKPSPLRNAINNTDIASEAEEEEEAPAAQEEEDDATEDESEEESDIEFSRRRIHPEPTKPRPHPHPRSNKIHPTHPIQTRSKHPISPPPIPPAPTTRSNKNKARQDDETEESELSETPVPFIRPHPTSSARTRPLPPRHPDVEKRVRRSIARGQPQKLQKRARGTWPKVVVRDEKALPRGETGVSDAEGKGDESAEGEGAVAGPSTSAGATAAAPDASEPKAKVIPSAFVSPAKSTSTSGSKPSPAKSVSFRVEGVDDHDEEDDGERVISSVESENGVLSQAQQRASLEGKAQQPQSQTQSQGNSSKGTVISDSQAVQSPVRNGGAQATTSPKRPTTASPSRPSPSKSRTPSPAKPTPGELRDRGKAIKIKPRRTASGPTVPPPPPESEPESDGYVPRPSESVASEEDKSQSEEEEDEIMTRLDAPSGRTRSRSIGDESSVSSRTRSSGRREGDDDVDVEEQERALDPFDGDDLSSLLEESDTDAEEAQQEEEDKESPRGRTTSRRSPASSPSLGGGGRSRTNTISPVAQRNSSSVRRQAVEVVVPSPRRSSQSSSQQSQGGITPNKVTTPEETAQDTLEEPEGKQGAWAKEFGQADEGMSIVQTDPDVSMANAMEVDELLASEGDGAVGMESIIDLTESSPANQEGGTLVDQEEEEEERAPEFVDAVEPVVDPPSQPMGRVLEPDSQVTTSSVSVVQVVRKTTSTLLPRLLDESSESQTQTQSQSQSQSFIPATQYPAPAPSQIEPIVQSQSQPQSQPQDRTHSSIEEPSSSWSIPPPGQPQRTVDTISSFTPTNPSVAAPPTIAASEGVFPPSSAPLPSSSALFPPSSAILPPSQLVLPPNELFPSSPPVLPPSLPVLSSSQPILPSSLAAPPDSAIPPSATTIPSSSLRPVPELSTDVFQRAPSPGSDIGQFSSPLKPASPSSTRHSRTGSGGQASPTHAGRAGPSSTTHLKPSSSGRSSPSQASRASPNQARRTSPSPRSSGNGTTRVIQDPNFRDVIVRERIREPSGKRRQNGAGSGAEGSRSRSGSRTESGNGGSPERVRDERLGGNEELEKNFAAQAKRINLLSADIAQLTSQKNNIELELNRYKHELAQIKITLGSERESHIRELTSHSKTITDLQNNLKAAQTQAEFAETQRKYALDEYNRASTQAKRLAGENFTLHGRAEKLEKQVDVGIRQLREGSEGVAEGLKQKIKGLEAQLKIQQEIHARANTSDICRRAAEWYEQKKRIEDLEAERRETDEAEQAMLERERTVRQREQELADREEEVARRERMVDTQPMRFEPDTQAGVGLSQDDMQTETMLTDKSAVLAELDGPMGEDSVWMCSYRETTDRPCGKVFSSMGLLLTHVLGRNGHQVDEGCHCV